MSDFQELEKSLEEQNVAAEKTGDVALVKQQIAKTEAETRKKLAIRFIFWYFMILLVILIGVPIYNGIVHQITPDNKPLILSVTALLQVYSSVVGPLAGFVIAYYFKNR